MATTDDLERLAELCLSTAKQIKSYLSSQSLPQPSFAQDASPEFPHMSGEMEYARMQLREASKRLYDLSSGPSDVLTWHVYQGLMDINAFRYAFRYQIAQAVPLGSSISYQDLASKTSVDVSQLKQNIRQLMSIHVFEEPASDHVGHTSASKALATHPGLAGFNSWMVNDVLPTVNAQSAALDKYGHGDPDPTHAAFPLAHNTNLPMFAYLETNEGIRTRFSDTMTYVSKFPIMSNVHTANGFAWSTLSPGSTVIDVAGNVGGHAIAIAEANPSVTVIVQDLPEIVQRATHLSTSIIPQHLKDRITFEPYDFWTPQPNTTADIYFMRMIMHDYSDPYCVKILRNIVSAMKPSARIVIMDSVLPPVGTVPMVIDRLVRTQDLQMMALLNAKERELGEWEELFRQTDPRLRIRNVVNPKGSSFSLIEVGLEDVQILL